LEDFGKIIFEKKEQKFFRKKSSTLIFQNDDKKFSRMVSQKYRNLFFLVSFLLEFSFISEVYFIEPVP